MFWLQEAAEKGAAHAEEAEQAPIIVQLVNHYFGEWAYRFEMNYTYPLWTKFFAKFHTTPEAVFGPYTPENAIPWYTVMFVIACILSVVIIWILKGQLSEEEPGYGQQTLEVGVLAVRGMIEDIIGPQGLKYFPGSHDFRGADSGFEPDGIVSAVHVAHGRRQRHLRVGSVFVSLLQLGRHQREWNSRSSQTSGGTNLVDFMADISH